MAQTKRKRRTKHRGTPAGAIEARGRTGRKLKADERGKPAAKGRTTRYDKPPTWQGAMTRAAIAAGIFFVAVVLVFRQPVASGISITILMFALYIPLGYYTDRFLHNRRLRQKSGAGKPKKES